MAEKSTHLHMRAIAAEKASWIKKAKEDGRSLASWVRKVLNTAAGETTR